MRPRQVGNCSEHTLETQELLAKRTKYALESFLQGNHHDSASCLFQGIIIILQCKCSDIKRLQWTQEAAILAAAGTSTTTTPNTPMSRHAIKMTTHLLNLADEIVSDDAQNHVRKQHNNGNTKQNDYDNNNNEVNVHAFSTSDWVSTINNRIPFDWAKQT
jgi:hypothetical protein